ncbi:acetoacetyl-CoA synthetase [Trichonephila clavipes]|nr:acetoacetyl-CoA synthetase [Trichonephila clavipes]
MLKVYEFQYKSSNFFKYHESLLGPLMHFTLHLNLKSGDVVHNIYQHGWTLWNYHVTCLSLGMKLLLQNGTAYPLKDGSNLWDVLSKYKVAFSLLLTSVVDKLEKMKAYPGRREDLFVLATELNLKFDTSMTIATLKDLIIGSENYDEELTKNIHSTIVENRKAREENLRIKEQKEKLRVEEQKEKLRIEEQKEKLRIEEREEKLRFEQLRLDEQKRKDEFELEKLRIQTQSKLGTATAKESDTL